MSSHHYRPGEALLSPVYYVSLFLMLFNDHYWKGVGPSWLTGKLSDVCILIMGPLVLQAFIEWGLHQVRCPWGPSRALLLSLCILMGFIMVAINLWSLPAMLYRWGMGTLQWPFIAFYSVVDTGAVPEITPVQLVMDPSDCWTAPCALFTIVVFWNRDRS